MRKVEIKMTMNKRLFTAILSIIIGTVFAFDDTNAATARTPIRTTTSAARRPAVSGTVVTKTTTSATNETKTSLTTESTTDTTASTSQPTDTESTPNVTNKSAAFETTVASVLESASNDNSFAEQIRKKRAALAAADASDAVKKEQRTSAATNSNACDHGLRQCMATKCGEDFTKCATDGDTAFGDKLNACRRDTNCTANEFSTFVTEIKSDRDMNVRLASYNNVINCGNQYNACIVNECGTTYSRCLGRSTENAAIQKCSTIAKECTQSDSGLANRFGTAIGKMRENAEQEIKRDEERLYTLRDSMSAACKRLGATFDERTFDCVFTVNFYAGENQSQPIASRKRYAGDTFVCMQEWFGVNATTYRENAYRETRAQSGASSAMLGSGVGTAAGLITSGAINRALDTQSAKKDLRAECELQGGTFKNGKCEVSEEETSPTQSAQPATKPLTPTQTATTKESPQVTIKVQETTNNIPIEIQPAYPITNQGTYVMPKMYEKQNEDTTEDDENGFAWTKQKK